MCGRSGAFSGKGHSPQLTNTCWWISLARCCHCFAEEIRGKLRGVFKSTGPFVELDAASPLQANLADSNNPTCNKEDFMMF
jgi:hypothetical protein